jgi:hypothetical protein
MKDREDGHGGYVRRVQDNLQRYTRGLLGENETLRRRVAQLEADHRELAEGSRLLEAALADNAALRTENGALRAERECLQERVAGFREEAARQQSRQAQIESHPQQIEEANRRSSEEYMSVQQENANLANLYVASYRLHGTVERREVVLAIQEIVANLIGRRSWPSSNANRGAPSSRSSRLSAWRKRRCGGSPWARGSSDGRRPRASSMSAAKGRRAWPPPPASRR